MFREVHEVGVFLWEVVRRVSAYITGGIVVAAVAVYEHLRGQSIASRPFLYGVGAFLIVAFYQTWQDEHRRVERLRRDLAGASETILYDGVLWSPLRIPHTTNTWTAGGPFCPNDRTPLQAVEMGNRRPPDDLDAIAVTISHLYCPTCAGEFRLGAPEAGHMHSVGDSRDGALRLILDSKGPAAVGMTPAEMKRDLKLGRLPHEWLR